MTSGPVEEGRVSPHIVVVGASAGGVESLRSFIAHLPADLPALVLVVLHVPSTGSGILSQILQRVSALPVSLATGQEDLRPGRIVVAPSDHHLLVREDGPRLSRGPRENGHRPSVDVLFRSAARAFDQRVIAVVLSGTMDDGTAGAISVAERGGLVLVQNPGEAAYPTMPQAVVDNLPGVRTAKVAELAAEVDRSCRSPVLGPEVAAPSAALSLEVELAAMDDASRQATSRPGVPAGFSCPDCFGSMYQIEDGGLLRFRCRVGHAWTAAGLLRQQAEAMEGALWMALRSLEEKAALSHQLAERALERSSPLSADRFRQQADDATQSAELVRRLIGSAPVSGLSSLLGPEGALIDV